MNALFDLNFLFDIQQHVIVRINEERNFAACQYLDLNLLLYTSVPYVEKDNTRYMVGVVSFRCRAKHTSTHEKFAAIDIKV
jgi:hypothetical protein